MAGIIDVDRNLVPKLLEVINLILINEENSRSKRKSSKRIHDAYSFVIKTPKQNHFLLGKQYSVINDCILNHRFEDAAKLLWVVTQDRGCFDMFLFKAFMIILDNLMPNDENQTVKKISTSAKRLHSVNRYEVQLDCLIYAFKNNIEDLQNSSKTLDKPGKGAFVPLPFLQDIYSAYCASLNYLKWVKICQDDTLSADSIDIAMNVINSLKKFIYEPGNWDIFVLKIIEMLEYYKEYDELEEILKNYVERNPEHINAYVYICVHLHKHKADSKAFVRYAKVLTKLCPSDERVLLLVHAWRTKGKKFARRLKILFYFLDYPTNKRHIKGWEMLSSHLQEATSGEQSDSMDIIQSFWSTRSNSWNHIHFLPSNIYSEDETYELACLKVHVLTILNPSHEYIQKAELRFPAMSRHKSTKDEVLDSENLESMNYYNNIFAPSSSHALRHSAKRHMLAQEVENMENSSSLTDHSKFHSDSLIHIGSLKPEGNRTTPSSMSTEGSLSDQCHTDGNCDSLIGTCIKCAFNYTCVYGEDVNVTCEVKNETKCMGSRTFIKTYNCRYCYQTPYYEHMCQINTSCHVVSAPRQRYIAKCVVKPHVLCLGNRVFAKHVPCNWTKGYSWGTALLLSIVFGGFGVDRFYLGMWQEGIGKLFSFGGLGVWTLVDVILIATGYLGPADHSLYIRN